MGHSAEGADRQVGVTAERLGGAGLEIATRLPRWCFTPIPTTSIGVPSALLDIF